MCRPVSNAQPGLQPRIRKLCRRILELCRRILELCRRILELCRRILELCRRIPKLCRRICAGAFFPTTNSITDDSSHFSCSSFFKFSYFEHENIAPPFGPTIRSSSPAHPGFQASCVCHQRHASARSAISPKCGHFLLSTTNVVTLWRHQPEAITIPVS